MTLPQEGLPYVCERCGFEYPLRQLRKEWTGLWVCRKDYDPKPAEMTPPVVRAEGVPKVPSRYPEDNDTPNTTTAAEI